MDKILNLGKSSSKCINNVDNVENTLTFPIIGKFSLTKDVFFPTYFSGGLATTEVSDESQPTRVLDRQPPPVVTQSYGSVTTDFIDREQVHSSTGEYSVVAATMPLTRWHWMCDGLRGPHCPTMQADSVGDHPHAMGRRHPRPLPTPQASLTESRYPATSDGDGQIDSQAALLPLEPWGGLTSPTRGTQWGEVDEDYYYDSPHSSVGGSSRAYPRLHLHPSLMVLATITMSISP